MGVLYIVRGGWEAGRRRHIPCYLEAIMAKLDAFFKEMKEQGASDMHLSVGSPPMLRLHGTLKKVEYPALTEDVLRSMLYEILSERQIEKFEKTNDLDFAYGSPGVARFRANYYRKHTGLSAAFRIIPFKVLTLDEIGAPEVFKKMCDFNNGLVLVTGPTGSGKSTTLASMIHYINATSNCHILTLEDPLEFIHEPVKSLISQREIGEHTESFASALKAALREDPDVILVGEMRDLETISLALTAAETGTLVFGTLHTNGATATVDRIINVFGPLDQPRVRTMLSTSLVGVVSQQLARCADGRGRVAAVEVMLNNPAIANLIREGKTAQLYSQIQTGGQLGMMTLERALANLVLQGSVSREEALAKAGKPEELARLLDDQDS